ncbi:MAG: hypothetical protein Ct9H90mP28_5050 [Paracoccaceae bacterium]|jgi:hypothetical protein|nr:MAG: hypothetical protein Ct9H90mP28_5050 [Paracoccaceae bacterium]
MSAILANLTKNDNYLYLILALTLIYSAYHTITPNRPIINFKDIALFKKTLRRLRRKILRVFNFVLFWNLTYVIFFISSICIAFLSQSIVNIIYNEHTETSYCSTRWFCRNYPQLCCRELQTYLWPIQSGFNLLILNIFAFLFTFTITIMNY